MNKDVIIKKTARYTKETMAGDSSGHDFWHVYRVWEMAKHIGKTEKVDMFVVEIAALLHDIADWKFHQGNEEIGPETARKWLQSLNVKEEYIEHVCQIVRDVSYKGAKVKYKMKTLEGMVVQDADKLDAIGAIGIARTFTYGGYQGNKMHEPSEKPVMHSSPEEYINSESTTINHFYEKLLLLKDRMNTKTAKKIALGRHAFMEEFLKRFYNEWQGSE